MNPFYTPENFKTPEEYKKWQDMEIKQSTQCINQIIFNVIFQEIYMSRDLILSLGKKILRNTHCQR